jgi:nicotinate-nucleotide adenylyltransferase
MRLGIFGGTFDPVHYGHLLLAESCREALKLDAVWFMPTAVPPHKQQRELAPAVVRCEMLELAVAGHAGFSVCNYEIERGGVNYTVDTLAHIQAEDPARQLFFLMGADSLRDLPTWKEPARLCELAVPVIVCRAGAEPASAGETLDWRGLERLISAERLEIVRKHQVPMTRIDLSSSDIRARVAEGRTIRYRSPRAVEMYIKTSGLYQASAEPVNRGAGHR